MSSTIGASQLGEAFAGASYQGYLEIASATLLVYDYIVTFDLEVQYVWTCKRWKSTSIFVINRCIMLDLALSLFLSTAYCPTETVTLSEYMFTFQGRDYFHRYGDLYFQISTLSKSSSNGLTIVIISCCTISDTMVLVITWWSLHSRRREGAALSIGQVLIRDGTLCFVYVQEDQLNKAHGFHSCLLLMNIAGMLTWYYSHRLTSIFVSRLMLHLREACFDAQNPSFYFTDVNGDELVFRSPPQVPGASAGVASV
ncbi:hypothetical protein WOLCODRAFT_15913 [Wolfiporia cocos MD-104 SS10]|uniref:DUF6533 domain-containing protein n=1 Tax=Wolfiporia cocos (strain MD-104) TaxID=742152 RepID=A0A2H3J8H2_WOLCO|nr:hypothetical protein WOLCODRAFT_15913 [Wolfiporia cocos MD-104 SS10]